MVTIYCNNHTCNKRNKCARYTRNYKIINKPVKNFKCQATNNNFIPL